MLYTRYTETALSVHIIKSAAFLHVSWKLIDVRRGV